MWMKNQSIITFTSDIQTRSIWDFSMASFSFLYHPEPFVNGIVTKYKHTRRYTPLRAVTLRSMRTYEQTINIIFQLIISRQKIRKQIKEEDPIRSRKKCEMPCLQPDALVISEIVIANWWTSHSHSALLMSTDWLQIIGATDNKQSSFIFAQKTFAVTVASFCSPLWDASEQPTMSGLQLRRLRVVTTVGRRRAICNM